MVTTDIGLWGCEALRPQARRNMPDRQLTVLDMHGTPASNQRVALYASEPSDARAMIAALRDACDQWEALVESIEAEATADETEPVPA